MVGGMVVGALFQGGRRGARTQLALVDEVVVGWEAGAGAGAGARHEVSLELCGGVAIGGEGEGEGEAGARDAVLVSAQLPADTPYA